MYSLYAREYMSERGNGRKPKKTPPTTVRLYPELDEFVRAQAETHSKGQSGVINDAVAHYKQHVEQKKRKLFLSIAGEEA